MDSRPELRKLLHDVHSRCATLNSAAQLLDECPDGEAVEMLDDMTESARDILRCLLEMKKIVAGAGSR